MKIKLLLLPLLAFCLLAISATSTQRNYAAIPVEVQSTNHAPVVSNEMKVEKFTFFQKIFFKLFVRKSKVGDEGKAERLSSTSLFLGIASWALLLLGLAVPYVAIASIPAGIAAMITGSSALRQGTSKEGQAKTGKGLGLGVLITLGALLIVAAIAVASWSSSWN
jgi:hypothetical protein